MYYEERIIGGILCSRTTPNGAWQEFTKLELMDRINTLTSINNRLERALCSFTAI